MTPSNTRNSLLLLMASIAAVGIQALMLSPVLPDIAAGLATSSSRIGLAAGAYGIGVALAALWAAPRMAQWQKAVAIRNAFGVLALGHAACALAPVWPVLALGQLVAGLAAGVIIPTSYAYTADLTPPEERSRAMGRVLSGWSIAMVAGVPLAAVLAHFAGWRGTFAAVSLVSLLMLGMMSTLPAVAAVPTAATRYADILKVPFVKGGYVATFAYMIGFYQTYTFLGDHVRHLHTQGLVVAGAIPLAYGVGFGLASALDRHIDRLGAARLLPIALMLVGVNYLILPAATTDWRLAMLYPAIWGVVNHICMTCLVSFLSGLSAQHRSGIMGLFTFVTYVSVGLGGAVYGLVYETYGFAVVSWAAALGLFAVTLTSWQMLRARTV